MAEEIIFKVGVDTGDSVNKVNSVGDAVENVDKETKKTTSSFTNLKKELRNLTIQLQGLDPASKEFEKVASRAGKIKEQLRGVADAINDADPEKFGGKFQRTAEGIAGSFSAITGAQALFGSSTEEIEKQMLKVQGAIALTQGISAMKELRNDGLELASSIKGKVVTAFTSLTTAEIANAQATNSMTAMQKIYTLVVGTSTGALKAFKIALATTGIGLLVVGLGLLVSKMMDYFKSTEQIIQQNQRLLTSNNKIINQIDERRQKIDKDLEKQLAYADALGKSEEDKYNITKKFGDKTIEQNDKEIKIRLDNVNKLKAIDLGVQASSREQFEELVKENKKKVVAEWTKIKELKTANEDLRESLKNTNVKLNRESEEQQTQANSDALQKQKEHNAKLKEEREKALREQLELERKIQDLTIANIEDTDTREIIALTTKHSRELEEIQKQYGKKKEFAELEKQLKIQQGIELENLEKEQATKTEEQKKAEKDKDNLDAKSKLEAELIRAEQDFNLKQQKRIELENLDFEQQMQNTNLTNGEREKIKAQHESNLVGIADESKERQLQIDLALKESKQQLITAVGSIFGELAGLAKQGSAIQKAFAITQVAIDTATAISGLTAISFSPANPANKINPLAPYIQLATGTAKIVSSMARVKSILGSGVSVAPPTIGGPNANVGIGANQTQQNTQQVQAQSTYKVVVVDSDITKMQDKTKKVQAISTI